MRFKNEVGYKALNLYANKEHVEVVKALLIDILKQLDKNCEEDGLDKVDVCDHSVAGLIQIFMDVAQDSGHHKLLHNLQYLAVDYGLSHLL
jgi:hypothetical protein